MTDGEQEARLRLNRNINLFDVSCRRFIVLVVMYSDERLCTPHFYNNDFTKR